VAGDNRWAGSYGVSVDFIAVTHCSVEFIPLEEILVGNYEVARWREEEVLRKTVSQTD
jgi:hypothetical protein